HIDLAAIREKYDPTDLEGTYRTYFGQDHPELSKLQGYIALLSGNLGDLYMSLSRKDQARYHSDYAAIFSHYQVRLAPDAVSNIYQLMTKNQLFFEPNLMDIKKNKNFILKVAIGSSYQAIVLLMLLVLISILIELARITPSLRSS